MKALLLSLLYCVAALLPAGASAQTPQVRVAHINHDRFPQVAVTLELNGLETPPTRDDFAVKAGDRPFPFEIEVQKASGNRKGPGREVLLLLDAGPWTSGNRLLEMKKALLQLVEATPDHTALAFAWYRPGEGGKAMFAGSQTPTTDHDLLRAAIQRVYSEGDTAQGMSHAHALTQAIEWFCAKEKDEVLREIILITPAGGQPEGEQPMGELTRTLEEKSLVLHVLLYRAQPAAVADQLRELAAQTRGKTPQVSNLTALQTTLLKLLGFEAATTKGKALEDYTVFLRFESDEAEDGTAREAVVRFRGQPIPVSYLAAGATFAGGDESLLDRFMWPMIYAAGGLMVLLLIVSLIRRQMRLRRELIAQRQIAAQAEQRMRATLAADQAAQARLAANVQVAPPQPVVPQQGAPRALVAQLDGHAYTFLLVGNTLTIGRSPDNNITLGHPSVSNRHAILQLKDGLWWLADLNSAQGVRLNGHPTRETAIAVGDTVLVGEVPLQVVL